MNINVKAKILVGPHKGRIVYGISHKHNGHWGIIVPELDDEFFFEGSNQGTRNLSDDSEYENLYSIFYDNGEEVQVGDRIVNAKSGGWALRIGVVQKVNIGGCVNNRYTPSTFIVKFFGEKRRRTFYSNYHAIKKISEIIEFSNQYDDQGNLI